MNKYVICCGRCMVNIKYNINTKHNVICPKCRKVLIKAN